MTITKHRAGRAPYNFIPLPEKPFVAYRSAANIPGHDRLDPNLCNGEIWLDIEALTDYYFRGLTGDLKAGNKDQPGLFMVNGRPRIPGSSLRGMLRSLIEIMASGFVDRKFTNRDQLFFRAVAASAEPKDGNSFEPQAFAYRQQLGGQKLDHVKVGYLTVSRQGWSIQPARKLEGEAKWARYKTGDTWVRKPAAFGLGAPIGRDATDREGLLGGPIQGWMICSGPIPPNPRSSKDWRWQWLVPGPDSGQPAVPLAMEDVDAYLDGLKNTGIRKELQYGWHQQDKTPQPCFYFEWQDRHGKRHITFGHTPNMRVPYQRTTWDAVPEILKRDEGLRESEWDMARSLFGSAEKNRGESRQTRVFVEDGLYVENGQGEPGIGNKVDRLVLGSPKPTLYQHYVSQVSSDIKASITWDGDLNGEGHVQAAGHKIFWHRPGAPVWLSDPNERGSDKVFTSIQVGFQGARFRATIRYRNTTKADLGLLLLALDLPAGCAHRLGMGKPLGLGSFRITIAELREVELVRRYRSFFSAEDNGKIEEGVTAGSAQRIETLKQLAAKVIGQAGSIAQFWQLPRHKELAAMLDFDGVRDLPDWNDRTRYLEFGPASLGGLRKNFNEYTHVIDRDRPDMQKRRPLPKPSEVRAGQGVPNDPRAINRGIKVENLRGTNQTQQQQQSAKGPTPGDRDRGGRR